MTSITQQIKDCKELKAKLLVRQDKIRANKSFPCLCGKRHKIKECVGIQTYYYVQPSGCTGGDYWNTSEIRIVCPVTEKRNRVLFLSRIGNRDDYDVQSDFRFKYSHLFKQRIDDHDDEEHDRVWVNNYYFDKHQSKFDLGSEEG